MKTPKVYQTKDYSLFDRIVGNRWIDNPDNERHVRKLMESFQEIYVPEPIIVSKEYGIIDGQNRFKACKLLGIPVMYIISKSASIKDVILMNNTQLGWKMKDYLQFLLSISQLPLEVPRYYKSSRYMLRFCILFSFFNKLQIF